MSNRIRTALYSSCAAALVPLFAAAPAAGQESGAVSAAIEEVTITARKRGPENVQDVPQAVTAFGSDQLEALNFQDLQSLSYMIPNVQLEDVGTIGGYANFSIRGLAINSSIPSIDPAVGVFVDGVYMGIPAGVVVGNFDLAGVEVLRGPQGVLFGRNVTGGAVLLRTSAPSDVFSVSARVAVETGPQYFIDATVTGPITPGLSAKLAAYYSDDSGWFENDFTGDQFGESQEYIIRPALRWAPNDGLEFLLRLETGHTEGDGPAGQNHAIFSRDSHDFAINEPGFSDENWDQAILEANIGVSFGNGTITNIAAWRSYDLNTLIDVDSTPGNGLHARAIIEQEQFSEELRYAGTFGSVDVTAGFYYFQQSLFYLENRHLLGFIFATGGGDGDFWSWASFLSADWHITEQLTLNLAARYTHEEKDVEIAVYGIDPGRANFDAGRLVVNFVDSESWSDVSPRIGLQWQPGEKTQFYGYWAKGFRAGGYNFRQTAPLTPTVTPGPFNPEDVTTYELGVKHAFADGKVRINAAVFHNDIEDMQRELNTPGTFGVNQQILNAGNATMQGFEVEVLWQVVDNFLLEFQAGYTDAEYDETFIDIGANGGPPHNDPNDLRLKIPRVSPWSYGASAILDLPLGEWGLLSGRVTYSHRDKNFFTDTNLGFFNAVDLFDANITFRPNDGPWSLSIYGKNLTDETTYGGDTVLPDAPPFGGDGPGPRPLPTFSPLNEGQVFGVELRVRF
jgi:iron complex outermembrane recepter protein